MNHFNKKKLNSRYFDEFNSYYVHIKPPNRLNTYSDRTNRTKQTLGSPRGGFKTLRSRFWLHSPDFAKSVSEWVVMRAARKETIKPDAVSGENYFTVTGPGPSPGMRKSSWKHPEHSKIASRGWWRVFFLVLFCLVVASFLLPSQSLPRSLSASPPKYTILYRLAGRLWLFLKKKKNKEKKQKTEKVQSRPEAVC